jgi:hypothetical protein
MTHDVDGDQETLPWGLEPNASLRGPSQPSLIPPSGCSALKRCTASRGKYRENTAVASGRFFFSVSQALISSTASGANIDNGDGANGRRDASRVQPPWPAAWRQEQQRAA